MRTTIDSAGRIVVPKALREAMGLTAGRLVDVVLTDGRLEIELAPVEVAVEQDGDDLPVLRAVEGDQPALTDDVVRETLESVRR